MKKDDVYYQAMQARDYRFDGKFFVGVKTTGIYCRPICPAKPKRENVEFFQNSHEAERAGYRPCMRCRPESAPHSPVWVGKSAIVQRAVKMLDRLEVIEFNEDRFADLFGVSARHLRRLFREEIGKTPKQLSFENRLNLSRKLLVETQLSSSEIAFASGFHSIRRFNDAFKERFKKSPSDIRRTRASFVNQDFLKISLPYRPPFDFKGLMHFYESHRTGNLEWFTVDAATDVQKMHRIVTFGKNTGEIMISNDSEGSRLWVEVDFPDLSFLPAILSRVRSLFDLDSDPVLIANSVDQDPKLKRILKKHEGIRLPTAWDPFEVSIAAILGQLVSVDQGRKLVFDLVESLGKDSGRVNEKGKIKLFPTPHQIVSSDLAALKTTQARKKTLREFSNAIAKGSLSLDSTQSIEKFTQDISKISGIGPWTANYIAMKALRHTDAFPESDLVLARALKLHSKEIINQMKPWRGYVAALLWREYAGVLKKQKIRIKEKR